MISEKTTYCHCFLRRYYYITNYHRKYARFSLMDYETKIKYNKLLFIITPRGIFNA